MAEMMNSMGWMHAYMAIVSVLLLLMLGLGIAALIKYLRRP